MNTMEMGILGAWSGDATTGLTSMDGTPCIAHEKLVCSICLVYIKHDSACRMCLIATTLRSLNLAALA